jgi:hypothetical protein
MSIWFNVVGNPSNDLFGLIFSRLKDKTTTPLKSSVVYRINCRDCASFYIEKTRVGQHKTAVNSGNSDYIALAEHAVQSGYRKNWVDYGVVTTDTRLKNRQVF